MVSFLDIGDVACCLCAAVLWLALVNLVRVIIPPPCQPGLARGGIMILQILPAGGLEYGLLEKEEENR